MSPARRSNAKTFLFALALSILGTVALLLMAETAVRVRWAIQHKDPAYLVMGIVNVKSRTVPRDVPVDMPTVHGTTQWNPCAQRDIYFRVNSAGGRGPEWPVQKPAGAVRILAVGESSTFGSANSEDQAWPALLEAALRAQGIQAEVLNFGIPGQRIERLIKSLPAVIDKYRPDVVVHYAGFNQTWDNPAIPNFLSGLNYRSMLYTYIYEKMYFRAEASALRLLPDSRAYEQAFTRLVSITRDRDVKLVVVQQAVSAGATAREGAECAPHWRDDKVLAACLNRLIEQPDVRYSRLRRARMVRTVVLQRVLADVAAREHLLTIDPRAVVVEQDNQLFCDEIHLTDKGNAALTGTIAPPLADYIRTQVIGPTGS
jgi:lysophospholipase L1-like esterase